ncbi:MAG: DNA polymerase I, partial [Alphaproteobacteria bacterium]|nr:DNA polymerase I [Alphaproteobacteria bacterium]
PGVRMFDAMKQKPIGEAEVKEKFGVTPDKVVEVLALIGDSSDNVPGVPGIGPKTAAELITTYGNLETLLARAGEIKQPKRRETIQQNAENARMSHKLVTLCHDCPLPEPLEQLTLRDPDQQKLHHFLEAQNFNSLLARLKKSTPASPSLATVTHPTPTPVIARELANAAAKETPATAPSTTTYTLVQDLPTLQRWLDRARAAGHVAFDTETTGLNANTAELVGFSLSITPGEACYVPVAHRAKREELSLLPSPSEGEGGVGVGATSNTLKQIPFADALAALKPLLADEAVLKIGQNIKYDALVLHKYGLTISPIDDTMLMSYVLNAGLHEHGLDAMAERLLAHANISYDDVTGTGKSRISFAEVPLEKARDYAAEDADITLRLSLLLKRELFEKHLLTVYETLERPLIPVLLAMEARGIKVDVAYLRDLSRQFSTEMSRLEEEIYALAGRNFTIGSPKQLGEILFDEMGMQGGRKGKSGAYSTDSEVLEELALTHDLPKKVLEWRKFAKLKSTYTDTLTEQVDKESRVHTCYSMAVASTGRLSSNDPNLQNIPIRTEEGKKIREAFIASPGHVLLSADYSQIELRLLAHIADIPTLKTAFKEGRDIHALTASQMFHVPVEEVTSDLRRKAKTINFGIIYGISAHGLSTRLGISRSEAANYIGSYFEQYPGIKEYMDRTIDFARKHGYVETLFGRRCHLRGIHDKNPSMRQFSERAAINAPLQGTAADIIKRAMITIHAALKEKNLEGTMLLQVHDELVFEVQESRAAELKALVKPLMEKAAWLSVPLTVEISEGKNWGAKG